MQPPDSENGRAKTAIAEIDRLVESNPERALALLEELERSSPRNADVATARGGLLIDIGNYLRNPDVIQRGIAAIEHVLPTVTNAGDRLLLGYNLGNGYLELHRHQTSTTILTSDPDHPALARAKHVYRETLKDIEQLPPRSRAELLVNFANLLDITGRNFEAIPYYQRALAEEPKHPMALGNLGTTLKRYADLLRSTTMLQHAQETLAKALEQGAAPTLGYRERRAFEKTHERIANQLAGKNVPAPTRTEPTNPTGNAHLSTYREFCKTNDLFLNLNVTGTPPIDPNADIIRFALLLDSGKNDPYIRLSRTINEIRERYAIARLLLFEADQPPARRAAYDDITRYTDNRDHAINGLQPASLKLAYEAAYNVLDKIAWFLNSYLELRIAKRQVFFKTIWRKNGRGALRSEIASLRNPYLIALYELSKDLAEETEKHETRNFITHRYIVLHTEGFGWETTADSPEYHRGYKELFQDTILLLKEVKLAITYLIAAVKLAEETKLRAEASPVPTQDRTTQPPYPYGPSQSPR